MKKNGKFTKRGVATKAMVMILSLMLVVGLSVGGTLAWLTATSGEVKNTFTVGDITIDLKEHDYVPATAGKEAYLDTDTEVTAEADYKFVPGDTLPKDPFVTVKANSEKCFLFVKVTEANNSTDDHTDDIIKWNVDFDEVVETQADVIWTNYKTSQDGHTEWWYAIVDASTADQKWTILKDNQVTVSEDVTKTTVTNMGTNKPTLSFTAAAVQFENIDAVDGAWGKLPATFTT